MTAARGWRDLCRFDHWRLIEQPKTNKNRIDPFGSRAPSDRAHDSRSGLAWPVPLGSLRTLRRRRTIQPLKISHTLEPLNKETEGVVDFDFE